MENSKEYKLNYIDIDYAITKQENAEEKLIPNITLSFQEANKVSILDLNSENFTDAFSKVPNDIKREIKSTIIKSFTNPEENDIKKQNIKNLLSDLEKVQGLVKDNIETASIFSDEIYKVKSVKLIYTYNYYNSAIDSDIKLSYINGGFIRLSNTGTRHFFEEMPSTYNKYILGQFASIAARKQRKILLKNEREF